ncbi:MAG: sigma-70 family RNA polymerase sigma factor [Candidatus Margulisbacteria bacterium]|jgi:RNA polymerase sigma-B factor|nr:sigma-70 family RNA polymerase sigma factor [Candidatus Margulisiibacteriota bacterium]
MAAALKTKKHRDILELKSIHKKIIAKLINGSLKTQLNIEKRRIVEENFPLAVYMAKKYMRRDVDIQDLVQVAAVGLIKAVRKYNPARRGKLSCYAIPTIDGELKHFIRDNCYGIRVSRKCVELNARIQKYREEFLYKHGREASRAEIARRFKLKKKALDKITQTVNAHYLASLDAPVKNNNGKEAFVRLEEVIGCDGFTDNMLEREGLHEALYLLSPRDQLILKYHFFREFSQDQIAARFRITQAQVSRIIKSACRKVALALM